MTQLVTVHVSPDGPPRVGEHSLTFGALESWSRVTVSFDGMTDAPAYLRDLAATCLGMAHMLEVRAEREAAR